MSERGCITQINPSFSVTVRDGESPVLDGTQEEDQRSIAVLATNFLRSGCPLVQVVYPSSEQRRVRAVRLEVVLNQIALPGESFTVRTNDGSSSVVFVWRSVVEKSSSSL